MRNQDNIGTCSVCRRKAKVTAVCSTLAAITISVCDDCLEKQLEPYSLLLDTVDVCGGNWPDDVNTQYRELISYNLKEQGISEEKFVQDLNKFSGVYND